MAHVGVKGFGAGDGQHDRAEQGGDLRRGIAQEDKPIDGVEGLQHRRGLHHVPGPKDAEGHEPHEHHRAEDGANSHRAALLEPEESCEDRAGDPRYVGAKAPTYGVKALGSPKHGNRRRDDPVAEEQGGPYQDYDHGDSKATPGLVRVRCGLPVGMNQGKERKYAPFAMVVRLGDEAEVLDAHDKH